MSEPTMKVDPSHDPTFNKLSFDDFEVILRQVLLSDDEELKSRMVMEPLEYVRQVLDSENVDNELKLRAAKILLEGAMAAQENADKKET